MLLFVYMYELCPKKTGYYSIIHHILHIFNRFFEDRFGRFADMKSPFLVIFNNIWCFALGREPKPREKHIPFTFCADEKIFVDFTKERSHFSE